MHAFHSCFHLSLIMVLEKIMESGHHPHFWSQFFGHALLGFTDGCQTISLYFWGINPRYRREATGLMLKHKALVSFYFSLFLCGAMLPVAECIWEGCLFCSIGTMFAYGVCSWIIGRSSFAAGYYSDIPEQRSVNVPSFNCSLLNCPRISCHLRGHHLVPFW